MKKLTLLCLSAIALVASSFTGAPDFEGKVVYDISIDGGNMPPEAMAMFAGSELTIYVKGVKSRADANMGFQNTSTITDTKEKTSVMLMDMMGSKYKIKSDPNAKKDEKTPEPTVKYLDETKDIAGYKCKKAEITSKDKTGADQVTTVFYTEEIANHMGYDSRSSQFKGIKGMLMEYQVNGQNGMKIKMTAKSVSKEKVPDSKFDIPSDYKETTMEDMQKDMQKKMQQR